MYGGFPFMATVATDREAGSPEDDPPDPVQYRQTLYGSERVS